MKKVLTLFMVSMVVYATQAQSVDEVIQKYTNAVGGKAKLNSISTLQYIHTLNLNTPMGSMVIPMTNMKVKNKLVRVNVTTELTGSSFSVVTDTSGWILIPGNPFAGTEAKLQKLKPEERSANMAQSNCEGFFPELVNYSAKGYKAEMAGEGKGNGKPSYKIKLVKDKDERLFYIDKETGLVNSLTVKGAAAAAMSGVGSMGMGGGGRADKMEVTMHFSKYVATDGVMFPTVVSIETPMGVMESTVTNIKLNKAVDAKWYRPE